MQLSTSGGTLIALAANQIVMGLMSQLSPLDVQIEYAGTTVSVNSFIRAYSRWEKALATTLPEAISYPDKHLVDGLDPIILEEISSLIATGVNYVEELLRMSGYEKAGEIAYRLTFDPGIHSKVIHYELARRIELNVVADVQKPQLWDTMRAWLRRYLYNPSGTHFVKYVLPQPTPAKEKKRAGIREKEATHAEPEEISQV